MADSLLTAEALTMDFGGFKAVDGVSLRVKRGGVHALIGPNGAGKTTCFNMLTKFLQPTKGRIFFGEHEITKTRPEHIARLGLVRSFQISAIFGSMTARENLRVALRRKRGAGLEFWRPERQLAQYNAAADELLEKVGLQDYVNTRASDLSYGRKRALEIATTLALDPELLLLDEPMAGMGHEDVDRVTALIAEIARDRTVLMVEHNLNVVSTLSDHITVMASGKVIAEGSYEQISRHPDVITAYLGEAHA